MICLDARQRLLEALTRVQIRPQIIISRQQLSDIGVQATQHLSLGFIQRLNGLEFPVQFPQVATEFLMIDSLRLLLTHCSLFSRGCGDVG
jgi:hypothetical protein